MDNEEDVDRVNFDDSEEDLLSSHEADDNFAKKMGVLMQDSQGSENVHKEDDNLNDGF